METNSVVGTATIFYYVATLYDIEMLVCAETHAAKTKRASVIMAPLVRMA